MRCLRLLLLWMSLSAFFLVVLGETEYLAFAQVPHPGGSGRCVTVTEIDLAPSVDCVNTIQFSNGSVTDNGSGTVTVVTGGSGPSGGNPSATISGTAVNGVASTFLRSDGAPALGTAAKTRSFGAMFDGGGAALVTGISIPVVVPFACTISAYSISVSLADTATFKVWKKATGTAIPTVADLINTSGVSISSNTHIRSTTVTDFTTTAVAADDIVIVQLSAVGGVTTSAAFQVECTL